MSDEKYLIQKLPLLQYIRYCILLPAFLIAIFIEHPIVHAQEFSAPEYEIKATFLYNFFKFVKWPNGKSTSFNICILGMDPFGDAIDVIKGKKVAARPIHIKYCRSIEELTAIPNCHILFISRSEKSRILEILDKIKYHPILTVSDQNNAVKFGVMINLVSIEDKIHFKINNKSALASGIKVSSRLLRLAKEIVE